MKQGLCHISCRTNGAWCFSWCRGSARRGFRTDAGDAGRSWCPVIEQVADAFCLPRAVDLAPVARGHQCPNACSEQGKRWSQYSFALISRADNRGCRTIVINRNASAESRTRSNRRPDQRMLAPVAVRFDGNPPNSVAGDTLISASDTKHQSILCGRLKIALRRCTVLDCDLNGLARGDLSQVTPIRFLHGPHHWVGCQHQQRTEHCYLTDSFRCFHRKSPYIRAYVARWMSHKRQGATCFLSG